MQRLVLLAYIATAPTLKPAPNGGEQLVAFQAEIAPYKFEDAPMPLLVTAWGSTAERVMTGGIQANSYANIVGRLRIQNSQPPEFQLSEFHGVSAPLALPGVNEVCLVGRAGRDPEVRYFESGGMVANLTLAVNRPSRDDEPDWFDLAVWGKQAQVAADYVRKGSLLGITGSFTLDCWTDRTTGAERTKPVIRVVRLDLLGSRRDAEGGGGPVRSAAPLQSWGGIDEGGDEIPF
jgi:single-strand DNA-binding protein